MVQPNHGMFWRQLLGLLHWGALVQLGGIAHVHCFRHAWWDCRRAPAAESQSNSGWEELLGASGPTPAQSTASLLGRWGCSRLVWRFWLSKDGEPSLTNPSTSKGTMSKAR